MTWRASLVRMRIRNDGIADVRAWTPAVRMIHVEHSGMRMAGLQSLTGEDSQCWRVRIESAETRMRASQWCEMQATCNNEIDTLIRSSDTIIFENESQE